VNAIWSKKKAISHQKEHVSITQLLTRIQTLLLPSTFRHALDCVGIGERKVAAKYRPFKLHFSFQDFKRLHFLIYIYNYSVHAFKRSAPVSNFTLRKQQFSA